MNGKDSALYTCAPCTSTRNSANTKGRIATDTPSLYHYPLLIVRLAGFFVICEKGQNG